MANYQQKEFHTVTPYVYGRLDLIDFLKKVLGAEERFRGSGNEEGFHAELKIGDSILMLGIAKTTPIAFSSVTKWGADSKEPPPATLYVYVDDVDTVYKRAIQAGAVSLGEPEDQPWKDRMAGFADSYGNRWWVASFKGA